MLFLTVLFIIVFSLLIYAMSSDKGKNTAYARKSSQQVSSQPSTLSLGKDHQPDIAQAN